MLSSTVLVRRAREHLTVGDVEYASRCCRAVLDRLPAHVPAHLLLAECLFEAGDYAQAKDLLLRVISSVPDDLPALRKLGLAMFETDGLDAAHYVFQMAFDHHPFDTELAAEIKELFGGPLNPSDVGLARLQLDSGRFKDAARTLVRSLLADPQRLDAYALLALAYHLAEDRPSCESVCEDLLFDAPDCLPALAITLHHQLLDDPDSAEASRLASQIAACDPAYQYVKDILPDAVRTSLGHSDEDIPLPSDPQCSSHPTGRQVATAVREPIDGESDEWMSEMVRSSNAGDSGYDSSPGEPEPSGPPPPDFSQMPIESPQARVSADDFRESERPATPEVYEPMVNLGNAPRPTSKNSEEQAVVTKRMIRQRMNEAVRSQQSNRFDEAVSEYATLLRSEPSVAGEIVENLRWIVYARPNHLAALKTLGDAYMQVGDAKKAVEQYGRVMSRRKANSLE